MNRIPVSILKLNNSIQYNQLKYLRAAVADWSVQQGKELLKAGISPDVFHNHQRQLSDTSLNGAPKIKTDHLDGIWRYPLVQYKLAGKHIEIIGLNEGAMAVQHLGRWFQSDEASIRIDQLCCDLQMDSLNTSFWEPILNDDIQIYKLHRWLPFNPKNYEKWKSTESMIQRVELLDKIIWGNFFQLFDSLGVTVDRKGMNVFIHEIGWQGIQHCFGIRKIGFDLIIKTNLNLQTEIGLGQGVSLGYGKVRKLRVKSPSKYSVIDGEFDGIDV